MGELGGAVELKCSVRNDTSSNTVEKTVVGLQLKFHKETGQHIVKSVSQNTPAARSELRNGDILVAVNGQSVDGMPPNQVKGLFKSKGSTPIEIEYRKADIMGASELAKLWPERAPAARAWALPEAEPRDAAAAAQSAVRVGADSRQLEKSVMGERREDPGSSASHVPSPNNNSSSSTRPSTAAGGGDKRRDLSRHSSDSFATKSTQGGLDEVALDPVRQDLEGELLELFRLRKAEQDLLIAELREQAELEARLERVRIERQQLAQQHHDLKRREEEICGEARRYRESVQRPEPQQERFRWSLPWT